MRVKLNIYIKEANHIDIFIQDFPGKPQKGDLIDPLDFIDDTITLTEDLEFDIYSLSYSVSFVVWKKDKDGIYLEVVCDGE